MIKVLIVDDHKSMCDSLTFALEGAGGFSVVGTLSDAGFAEIYCEKLKPDLVFMDVCTSEGASGLDATMQIRKKFPDIKVVVMSGFDEITFTAGAEEAGAHAFIRKGSSLVLFIDVARGVLQGKTYWPEKKSVSKSVPEIKPPFTEPEMDVLRLMCRHKTSKEIAQELEISEETVAQLKSEMLTKTEFDKTIDLVFHAFSEGWVNL